jgi:hypothetical protein
MVTLRESTSVRSNSEKVSMQQRTRSEYGRPTHYTKGMEILSDIGHHRTVIWFLYIANIRDIEKLGDIEVLLSNGERESSSRMRIRLVEGLPI